LLRSNYLKELVQLIIVDILSARHLMNKDFDRQYSGMRRRSQESGPLRQKLERLLWKEILTFRELNIFSRMSCLLSL